MDLCIRSCSVNEVSLTVHGLTVSALLMNWNCRIPACWSFSSPSASTGVASMLLITHRWYPSTPQLWRHTHSHDAVIQCDIRPIHTDRHWPTRTITRLRSHPRHSMTWQAPIQHVQSEKTSSDRRQRREHTDAVCRCSVNLPLHFIQAIHSISSKLNSNYNHKIT